MRSSACLLTVTTIVAVVLRPSAPRAQSAWATSPVASAINFRIDDQLFDVADRPDLQARRLQPQGATVDSNAFVWALPFHGWEGGVIPIEFGAEVTAAQRTQFFSACLDWGRVAPVSCIEHTSQLGYLVVRESDPDPSLASGCYSNVGQARRLVAYGLHLSPECWNTRNIHHELGHAFGFIHEHQRPDRDNYIVVDLANVVDNAKGNFTRIGLSDPLGPYDFLSVMQYRSNAFAIDSSKPTMTPAAGYGSFAATIGTAAEPSDLDHAALGHLYAAQMRPLSVTIPLESPRTRFDRTDFLDAMERLSAFYAGRNGLNRTGGLSLGGRPDFQSIASWIFDLYLAARSRGFSSEQSFGIVVADITQTNEWRVKHGGQSPMTRPSFTPVISPDRNEFLDALQRLDVYYSAPEGLQRPSGLSISGGPDLLGIATWIFDVYLNERLAGSSSTVAWNRVVNAIQATDEWRRKH